MTAMHDWHYDKRAGSPNAWAGGSTGLPTSQDVLGAVDRAILGTQAFANYEPQTTADKFTGAVASFVPGAATGGANLANIIRYGVIPGLLSEGAGQAAEAYDPNNETLAAGVKNMIAIPGGISGMAYKGHLADVNSAANPSRSRH
jgi:hypothetical protein